MEAACGRDKGAHLPEGKKHEDEQKQKIETGALRSTLHCRKKTTLLEKYPSHEPILSNHLFHQVSFLQHSGVFVFTVSLFRCGPERIVKKLCAESPTSSPTR